MPSKLHRLLYFVHTVKKHFFHCLCVDKGPLGYYYKLEIKVSIFGGVTFHLLLVTCWSLLITLYSLQNSLVTCCKFTCYMLVVAEVTGCKKSLVTCCKIHLLLVPEVARCKKSLVTRCTIRLLLVAELAYCRKSPVTCFLTRCRDG